MELDDNHFNKKSREAEWDVFKGILMICVVIGHLDFGDNVRQYIYAFHMPLFFLISGFFYHPSTKNLRDGGVKNRAKSLLEPYIFMVMINYIFWIVLYRAENIFSPIIHIFWANTVDGIPIAGALWFLTSLFFVYLIVSILDRIDSDKWKIFVIISFAIIGSLLKFLPFRLPLGLDCAIEGTVFFEMGYFLQSGKILSCFLNLGNKKIAVLSSIALGISLPLIFLNGTVNFRDLEFAILPLTYVNALLSLIVYLGLSKIISTSCNKWGKVVQYELQFIGRNTLVFLGFHQLARWFVVRAVNKVIFIDFCGVEIIRRICYVVGCIVLCQLLTHFFNNIKSIRRVLHILV